MTLRTPVVTMVRISPPRGLPPSPFRAGHNPRRACWAAREPYVLVTDTPCRATPPSPDLAGWAEWNQGLFPQATRQRHRFRNPKCLPPPSPPDPAPCWRLEQRSGSRHWYLGLAASAQLPTRVCAQSLRARPNHLAGYSPEISGHVLPVDFYNQSNPRAQPRTSRPRPLVDAAGEPAARSGGAALARRHQLNWLGSGVAPPHDGGLATPRVCIRAVADLPQAVPTQTPLVAHRHPSRSG